MKQPEGEPSHLRLVPNGDQPGVLHLVDSGVTDEKLGAKPNFHLVDGSEMNTYGDTKQEIDVGPPIVRGRYDKIFKPRPPSAK